MSEVWNHFYMAPNGLSVNCNHCGKFMKRSDSSTKSMWGHLKAFHSELVGEETFRLKRTRRMRGNEKQIIKKEAKKKKKSKIEQKELTKNYQNQSSSSCNSSNLSEISYSGEDEEIIKYNNNNEEVKREIKIKKEENQRVEVEEHLFIKEEEHRGSALSIQTLLKLDSERKEENNELKFEIPQNYLQSSPQLQNLQQFTNQSDQFKLPCVTINQLINSPTCTKIQKTSPLPCNSPKIFPKYSTAALLQKQQQNDNKGKVSPAHGSEAPLPNFNSQKMSEAKLELQQFNLTNLQHLEPSLMGLNEQKQNNLALGSDDPANLLARLETAAIMNQLALQKQQLEKTCINLQNGQIKEEKQPNLNEMLALLGASAGFQQQNGQVNSNNIFQNFQNNVNNCFQQQQQASALAALAFCNFEWMTALQQRQNPLNPQTPLNTQIPLQQFLFAQTQQQLNKQTCFEPNKPSIKAKNNQKRKSGLVSATLLTTPSTTEMVPNSSLQVLAETASSKNLQNIPKDQSNSPLSNNQQKSSLSSTEEPFLADSLTESLILYGMHRIAMELLLSYSVQANKQGKAEYAFYKNAGGISTIQNMITLTESTDQQMLNIREYYNGTIIAEEFWPKNLEPCSLLNSLRDKCQRRLCN